MGYGDAVENTSLELPEGARVEKFSANASFRASVYDFLLEMPCDVIDEFAEANQLRRPRRYVGLEYYLHQTIRRRGWLRHSRPLIKAHGDAEVLDARALGVSAEDVRSEGSCTVVYTIVRE